MVAYSQSVMQSFTANAARGCQLAQVSAPTAKNRRFKMVRPACAGPGMYGANATSTIAIWTITIYLNQLDYKVLYPRTGIILYRVTRVRGIG